MLTATKKEFLKSLAVVPKKKLAIRKSKDQKESDALRTAFKNYRRAERSAMAEIKNLSKQPDMESSTESLEERVRKVQDRVKQETPNQDAATAIETLNEATEDIKEIKEDATDAIRFSHKYDDNKVEEARHRPVYEDKVRRIKEERDRLAQMPGTAQHVEKLDELLKKGEKEVKEEKYGSAYKQLTGLSGAVKGGEKAAKKFRETAGGHKEAQAPLATAEKNLAEYAELADLADGDWIAEQRKAIDAQLKRLEAQGADVKDVAAQLTTIGNDLADKLKEVKYHAVRAEGLLEQAAGKIFGDLTEWAPANVAEPFRSRLILAKALVGSQQYAVGADQLKELLEDVSEPHATAKANYEEWQRVEKQLKDDCLAGLQQGSQLSYTVISQFANGLLSLYNMDARKQVTAHDYKAAAATAQGVVDRYPDLKAVMDRYEHLKGTFDKFEEQFNKRAKVTGTLIQQLAKAKGDTAPHQKNLDDARAAWDKELDRLLATQGVTADDIDRAYKIADQAVLAVARAVDNILKDGTALGQSQAVAENKDKQEQYNKLIIEVQKRVKHLEQDDPGRAKVLREQRLDPLLTEVKNNGFQEAHLGRLKTIHEVLEQTLAYTKETNGDLAGKARQQAEAVKQKALELKSKNKDFAAYLDGLVQRADDCVGMTGAKTQKKTKKTTTDVAGTVVDAALKELKKLDTEIDEAAQGIAEVAKKLKELREELDDKEFKACVPSRRAVLLHKMRKELRDTCRGMSPQKALATPDGPLAAFEAELKTAQEAATKAGTKRKTIAEDADKLLEGLDKSLKDASHFKKGIEARLKRAKKPNEGGEANSELELKAIAQILEDAKDDDRRMALESKARLDEQNNEQAKKDFEAACDVFEKNDLRLAKEAFDATPKRDRDPGPLRDIRAGYKDAKKTAKQGGYVVAKEKLAEIGRQARAYAGNPMGARTTARNNLKKVNAKWKQAVAAYVRAVGELKKSVEDEATTLGIDANGVKAAQKQLDRLAALFDASRFDKAIKVINDDATDLTQLRMWKEVGLRRLRRYRELLKKDPMLDYISPNPFTDFTLDGLEGRLKDLELNLLRA